MTIIQCYLLQSSGHNQIHTIKYRLLSIWGPNKGTAAALHQNKYGFHFPKGKQHNEESGGLMILVNNSLCGPFGVEFSGRLGKKRDRRERGVCLVTVIHFEYNQELLL